MTGNARGGALAGLVVAGCALALPGMLLQPPATAQDGEPRVLAPVTGDSGPGQNPAIVSDRIAKLANQPAMGKSSGTVVMDAASGDVLFDDDGGTALTPASTNKITTSLAAVRLIGADQRIRTVVRRAPQGREVFLVGGGDPLLVSHRIKADPGVMDFPPPTSMRHLARGTAASLKQAGQTSIRLNVDDSLFTGPDWGPDWPQYFRTAGIVSPVSALMVNDGRVGGRWGMKVEDPAMNAGEVFADLLRGTGITVNGVRRGAAPQDAEDVAAVQSAPIYDIVAQALTNSDNDTAEALFRLAGVAAGFGGSFQGGGQAVDRALREVGLSDVMATFADGSGLSKQDHVPPRLLADVLRRVVNGDDGLWPIGSGLAVAGVTGTLRYRFTDSATAPGAGWVRAKTGTLTGVSSLAGFMQSRSGRVLVFASIANDAPSAFDAARVIDQIVTEVAGCGCS